MPSTLIAGNKSEAKASLNTYLMGMELLRSVGTLAARAANSSISGCNQSSG